MPTTFRLICLALLAVPAYWTADKLLQIHATSIAKDRVRAQVQDETYLSELFDIPTPFHYADYVTLEGKSLKDNAIAGQLKFMHEARTKPFRIHFKYTDGVEKVHWYEYPTDGCTVVYCAYNPGLLHPIPSPLENDVTSLFREKWVEIDVLIYAISTKVSISQYKNGKVEYVSAYIANEGRNPIDRAIRKFTAALAPEFWQIKWDYSFNAVSGIITEKDY